jgi:hypothetical protein
MRRGMLLLPALLVLPLLGSDSPKEYDDKVAVAGIEGTWRLTEYELDGAKREPNFRCSVTVRNGTFTVCCRRAHLGDTLPRTRAMHRCKNW